MADGLDDLEKQAEERRARGRKPGGSRHPRPTKEEREARAADARQVRDAERKRREEERRQEAEAAAKRQAEADAEAARTRAEQDEATPDVPADTHKKRPRPDSQTWYPDPDNVEFLWAITEAATTQREKVPATAVIRFALRRLQDQMAPGRIVQELSGPVQTEGKLGRPRR